MTTTNKPYDKAALIRSVTEFLEEHASEHTGITRKQMFDNLPSEITGDNYNKFCNRVAYCVKRGCFPKFITKQRIGTVKISEKDQAETQTLTKILDEASPGDITALATVPNISNTSTSISTSLAFPQPKLNPLVLNQLVGELSTVQLQVNNIQAKIISMMGV